MMEKRITAILVQSTLVHHGIALHGFDYSRILADIFIFFNWCQLQPLRNTDPFPAIVFYHYLQSAIGVSLAYTVWMWHKCVLWSGWMVAQASVIVE